MAIPDAASAPAIKPDGPGLIAKLLKQTAEYEKKQPEREEL